jgi:hypothetical protein
MLTLPSRGALPIAAVVFAVFGLSTLPACTSAIPGIPSPPDLTGAWIGEQTLTDLSGGDCLGPALQDVLGLPSQFHATLAQSGNKLTASLDIDHTGGRCDYEGSIVGDSLVLTMVDCHGAKGIGLSCPAGGVRDLVLQSESLQAKVNGGTIRGTATEADDVRVSGMSTSVGLLIGTSSFNLIRQ